MGRPERPIDPDAGSVAEFAGELRKLRDTASKPSYRELARRATFPTPAVVMPPSVDAEVLRRSPLGLGRRRTRCQEWPCLC
jgi:hypothetical protein